jgi:hypothetical protein
MMLRAFRVVCVVFNHDLFLENSSVSFSCGVSASPLIPHVLYLSSLRNQFLIQYGTASIPFHFPSVL